MLILVDQDNVLADFDAGFLAGWRATHPDAPFIPHSQRRAWNVRDDLPAEHQAAAVELYSREGFFRNLAPIAGGREALFAMLEMGWDVRICTSPIREYRHCVAEKFAWVEAHLGAEWLDRIVLTADKTVVHGDWLLDDKVDIRGGRVPSWRHALFDAHHNRHIGHGLRIDWSNWRDVLARPTR